MEKQLKFIIIGGPMGAGKSSIAKILKQKLKRTAVLGCDDIKWVVSDFNRGRSENAIAHKVVLGMCDEYLKNEVSILIHQGFYSKERMDEYVKMAKKHACKLHLYQLVAPRQILLDRIASRPMAIGATKPLTKTRILRNLRNYQELYYSNVITIDTSKLSLEEAACLILKDLNDLI